LSEDDFFEPEALYFLLALETEDTWESWFFSELNRYWNLRL